jgi:hypothetical protein
MILPIIVHLCHEINACMDYTYWEHFFDSSREYFSSKLESFENKRKISFNFHAFLFGFLWFLYRKMFRQALYLIGCVVLVSLVENLIFGARLVNETYLSFIVNGANTLFFSLFTGFFGNWIYLAHAKKELSRIVQQTETDEQQRLQLIRQRGGTSHGWVITILIIMLISQLISSSLIK